MTTGEFLNELGRVRYQFEWILDPDGAALSGPDSVPRLRLRAMPKTGSQDRKLDPISAVCYARLGQAFKPGSWADAGEALGMIPADSAMVFAASDRTWTPPHDRSGSLDSLDALRARMIQTVGLDPGEP